ncbi:hypothetical protein BT63DRAFT_87991 [Microthyrium microscopicum]|uniref:Rhodopsin domain-containing protein n=1 Tax=Microthyrium microscopicum TaxID=703497 RepID=A0A6A6U0R1_9PEZI|nr:hypothetical protein BT63DRAFT_87991 [Microthyrium microscopicum]
MRDIPISVILSFPPPNYTNPVTRGPAILYVNGVLLVICTIFVLLRFYSRTFIKRSLGWDDLSLLLGYIFAVGLAANVMLANNVYYWNRHIWDIPLTSVHSLGKTAMAAKVLFTVAVTFIRMALLLFYYRLVKNTGMNWFKWVIHSAMAFNIAIFIAFTLLSIFQCQPIAAYWTLGESDKCLNEGRVTLGSGVINCIADLLTTLLPIPMVMRLNMPMGSRIGVSFLLSLGLTVTVAGVIRTYFIWKALIGTYDETWYSYPLWISAAVEVELGVITASIPPLRALVAFYYPSLRNPLSALSDRFDSFRSRGTANTTSGHSTNVTEPLSRKMYSMDSEKSPYPLSPMEKMEAIQRPATVGSAAPRGRDLQIFHRTTYEVKHTPRQPPFVTDAAPQLPGLAPVRGFMSPIMGSSREQTRSRSSMSHVFTRWISSNSSGQSETSHENSLAAQTAANLPQHPLRHDDGSRSRNLNSPMGYNDSRVQSPDPDAWPLQDSIISPARRPSTAEDQYSRVEIRRNPFAQQAQRSDRHRNILVLSPSLAEDSTESSMTDHFRRA